jgi:hypothetical protein
MFISNFANAPKWGLWDEGKGEKISQGPVGVGATFQWWEKLLGKKMVYNLQITEWEPNKKLAFWIPKLASGEPGTLVVTLEPVEGKTRMIIDVGFELTGYRKLIRPAFGWAIRREGWALKIKSILEARAL